MQVSLVEFGPDLVEIHATPLENYLGTTPTESHGIVGIAYLADGRMVFTTHAGQLYCIEPRRGQAALVTPLGWFHPAGTAYTPSLFALDGQRYLAGIAQRTGGGPYEWLTYDLQTNQSNAELFPLADFNLVPQNTLLYGSIVRDDAGACYLVGISADRPVAFKVHVERQAASGVSDR